MSDRPPSWRTAATESEAAQRQVAQAQRSLEKGVAELRALRAWGDCTARLETARRLTEGEDGGTLNLLLATAESGTGDANRACRAALDRLTAALGLAPIGNRGELLRLGPDQVVEFEVRGGPTAGAATYRVVRPGWTLDDVVACAPVLVRAGVIEDD